LVAFKSLASGKSWLTEQSGRSEEHCAGGSMIAFSLSITPDPSPHAATASSVAQSVQSRVVCGGDIIVKLLTLAGNHTTAYCDDV
jgi:hypothetical protein